MTPLTFIAGAAVVLDVADLDTDQILPARFLGQPRGTALQSALFHDLRGVDPMFPLRADGNPPILLAGANFGCGGSREAAIHAMLDAGIRCVIARGFGCDFTENACRNGLLTVVLPPDMLAQLRADCRAGAEVAVDLERERISCARFAYRFDMDRFHKDCLLRGIDELAMTLDSAVADAIDRFEGADARLRSWATPA